MKKIFVSAALLLILSPALAQSANDLFQQALTKERSEGNLQEAISLYERVVAIGSDRALAAKALIRIGANYERLGLQQALQAYQRVLDNYSEQQDVVQIARERLSTLKPPASAEEIRVAGLELVKKHVMNIPDTMGKVSPDGKYLSFVEWTSGNEGYIDLETGEQILINSDGSWGPDIWAFGDVSIWSPDSKNILYLWLEGDGGELRIFNIESEETEVMVPLNTYETPFPISWLNRSNGILAINEIDNHVTDAITFVDVESAQSKRIKVLEENWHTFHMAVSPDDEFVAYQTFQPGEATNRNAPAGINLISADGMISSPIVEDGHNNYAPQWNAAGTHVLYLSTADGTTRLMAQRVEQGQPSGPPLLVHSDFEGSVDFLGMTDDDRYFYSQAVAERHVYEQGINFETGELMPNLRVMSTVRYGDQRSGAVSPDGEHLAFISQTPGDFVLSVTHLDTGETTTHELPYNRAPSVTWTMDGKSLLVPVANAGPNRLTARLYMIDRKGGSSVELSAFQRLNDEDGMLNRARPFSVDGSRVLFSTRTRIVELDVSDNSERVIREFTDGEMRHATVSPDGRFVGIVRVQENVEGPGKFSIEIVSTSDGSITRVDHNTNTLGYSNMVGLAWTPDGKKLIYAENRTGQGQQVFALDVDTRVKTAIGEPVFDEDQYQRIQVHPSGNKITYGKREAKLGLWVLEGIEL